MNERIHVQHLCRNYIAGPRMMKERFCFIKWQVCLMQLGIHNLWGTQIQYTMEYEYICSTIRVDKTDRQLLDVSVYHKWNRSTYNTSRTYIFTSAELPAGWDNMSRESDKTTEVWRVKIKEKTQYIRRLVAENNARALLVSLKSNVRCRTALTPRQYKYWAKVHYQYFT